MLQTGHHLEVDLSKLLNVMSPRFMKILTKKVGEKVMIPALELAARTTDKYQTALSLHENTRSQTMVTPISLVSQRRTYAATLNEEILLDCVRKHFPRLPSDAELHGHGQTQLP
ncbi:hypothetical protein CHS0354_024478 [Potamilus streckersoni]|uniref:Uncharacterized protein n=1 Tax=Potamilus streckersoni TaxID=2493646 RepID=A0AAE0WEN4_9BIVA|nr:hypothetical protein CHS0354_024478 [Potamilus streckersoni]